jgi:hypothetical protein
MFASLHPFERKLLVRSGLVYAGLYANYKLAACQGEPNRPGGHDKLMLAETIRYQEQKKKEAAEKREDKLWNTVHASYKMR